MRSGTAPKFDAAIREHKERRLRQFINAFIDRLETGSDTDSCERLCLLLARSPDSPVAHVIAEMIEDRHLQVSVRAIFATLDTETSLGRAEPAASPAFAAAVRLARDPRLLHAHEQLVLGTRTSWIGDCMRRDPLKRDAYETFAADGRGKARRATASFERIWRVSVPVPVPVASPLGCSVQTPFQPHCAGGTVDDSGRDAPGTRIQSAR